MESENCKRLLREELLQFCSNQFEVESPTQVDMEDTNEEVESKIFAAPKTDQQVKSYKKGGS